tara:strand:- start:1256 stop:2857 length:1602 start_codon:yes stop_codon:yes gene_type:complete
MKINSSDNFYLGKLAFVLHAHLPYVRKNEINSLEEDWLFQAILECYLPLLRTLERASKIDPQNTKLTINLSPTLVTLLLDKRIQNKFPEWIKTRIEFLNELPPQEKSMTSFLQENLNRQLTNWISYSGNLIDIFKKFSKEGYLDIITCAATHGYLPILRENPETVVGQIKTAIRFHKNIFNATPLGIWLPECAYYENLDEVLFDSGIRYAVLDGHGVLNAKPRPRYGVYAPICSKRGVAFFGRDSQSTLPVWSSREGFPGDPSYREFHKDLGWELPILKLQEKGIQTNRPLGLKFHRITNNSCSLGDKEIYSENVARKKAEEHAEIYLSQRSEQLKKLKNSGAFTPILIAPFDAELFGHWWYEGPIFIENIFIKASKYSIKLTHLKEILSQKPNIQICNPSPSSWGQGGYHNYWLNDKNAWIVPEITKAGTVFVEMSQIKFNDKLTERIYKQAARELLLAESSDWSFILRAGTTTELAKERIKRHIARFWKLVNFLNKKEEIDLFLLESIEEEDKIFPDIRAEDWRLIQSNLS